LYVYFASLLDANVSSQVGLGLIFTCIATARLMEGVTKYSTQVLGEMGGNRTGGCCCSCCRQHRWCSGETVSQRSLYRPLCRLEWRQRFIERFCHV